MFPKYFIFPPIFSLLVVRFHPIFLLLKAVPTHEHYQRFHSQMDHASPEGAHLGVRRFRLADGAVERGSSGQPLSQTLFDFAQLL